MSIIISSIFIVCLTLIIIEDRLHLNKTGVVLTGAALSWALLLLGATDPHLLSEDLVLRLSGVGEILLFLMGTMSIVEVINSHGSFALIGQAFRGRSLKATYWGMLVAAFFMSSVLDNLTTLLVWVCIMRKLVPQQDKRALLVAALVPAVNAGGAWTPIGDVTTTMLWINGHVSSADIMSSLFVPSLVLLVVFGLCLWPAVRQADIRIEQTESDEAPVEGRMIVLVLGVMSLVSIPVLKLLIGLPPFMAVMLGLGLLWIATDFLHREREDGEAFKVYRLLGQIDWACILFFFGILFMVDALEVCGTLETLSRGIGALTESKLSVTTLIGVASAVVDNVPLVALAMKMYASSYLPNDVFWNYLALTAGTGGSLLIIGSAPGVALMALERIGFVWYLRWISWAAAVSFAASVASLYLLS